MDGAVLVPEAVVELRDAGVEVVDFFLERAFLRLGAHLGLLALLDAAPQVSRVGNHILVLRVSGPWAKGWVMGRYGVANKG